MTAFNVAQLVRLTASQRTLGAHAVESEREAARLRADAAAIRGQINEKELEVVANAAREANGIIDQRAFSWSELFDQLEQTLPDDVRITAVDPSLGEKGSSSSSSACRRGDRKTSMRSSSRWRRPAASAT